MKKAEGYVIRKLEEEYVLIPCGERAEEMNETISLSETAGFIYINAGKADSTEELAGLVAEEYDVPKSEVLEDVKAVVKTYSRKEFCCKKNLLFRSSQKSSDAKADRTQRQHKKPQSREKAVRRILYRNFLSVAYKGDQAAFDLVGTQRTFDFRLIVSDHKESLRSDLTDAVQDKDTLVTTVKNDIIFADRVGRDGFDQGFIASRDKEWVHTVALWSDADDVAVLKQSFKIRSGRCHDETSCGSLFLVLLSFDFSIFRAKKQCCKKS